MHDGAGHSRAHTTTRALRRALTAVAAGLAAILVLSGCATARAATSAAPAADRGPIEIVASTNVWGDIAAQLGGSDVVVRSLIADMSLDAHDFQPSGRDALAVSRAAIVIENGGGYDDFMKQLRSSTHFSGTVIDAVDVAQAKGLELADNEHVFFSPRIVQAVAARIAATLTRLAPDRAPHVRDRLAAFDASLGRLIARTVDLRAAYSGTPVLATEPVAGYLIADLGLSDRTPPELADAVESGTDVRPSQLAGVLDLVAERRVAAVLFNEQEPTAQADQIVTAARQAHVPIVPLTELLPAGTHYVAWVSATLTHLAAALTAGTRR